MAKQGYLILLVGFLLILSGSQQKMKPKDTEVWEPVPKLVKPGIGTAAPSDAIILFDGSDLSKWRGKDGPAKWLVKDGVATVVKGSGSIFSKQSFADVQLHLEWRTPAEVSGQGQGRGNSGVFLQNRYEVQILDSYQNKTYANGQAGSIYKQHIPQVNASLGPGQWQSYDIIFTAPRFKDNGELEKPAFLTVFHNGILVQNHVELLGTTVYIGHPEYKSHGPAPIQLQNHTNPVSFRNIWVRKLKEPQVK